MFVMKQNIMHKHVQIIKNHLKNPNLINFSELDVF